MNREQMLELMAYADGELDGDARAKAEALVASDPHAARFVASLAPLGDAVREGYEAAVQPRVGAVDLADAIMARVAATPADADSAPREEKVRSLRARDEVRASRASRRTIGAVAFGALALAASFAIWSRPKDERPLAQAPITPPAAAPSETVSAGVEVEAVDSPGNSVSVFYLPSANELSTSVVVWVDETGEK